MIMLQSQVMSTVVKNIVSLLTLLLLDKQYVATIYSCSKSLPLHQSGQREEGA